MLHSVKMRKSWTFLLSCILSEKSEKTNHEIFINYCVVRRTVGDPVDTALLRCVGAVEGGQVQAFR